MQSPPPRVPEQTAPTRADNAPVRAGAERRRAAAEARLTAELVSVLSGARRRALRDGDAQIDTAHLLHSLLETDPEVRSAFDSGDQFDSGDHVGGQVGDQVVKVLGYLVQRSIGYGLRWQRTVEDSGAMPVVRERAMSGWSPGAVTAMRRALERAARHGEPRARGLDLLAALVSDRECRAVDVLVRAGVDAEALAERLSRAHGQGAGPG
ncbi:Clp protease N-terminal domain-containing protein [Streptomyces sp. NPDC059568]|uniref:Clp protease N-terminal domain-containing protein n=1 Tax=Streptomyces sp. NPDC059568 TaxID=3346868 RepID=UPI0036CFA1C1